MKYILGALACAVTAAQANEKVLSSNKDVWTGSTVADRSASIMTTSGETFWREPGSGESNIYYNMVFSGSLSASNDEW